MKGQYVEDLMQKGFSEKEAELAYHTFISRMKTELSLGDGNVRLQDFGSLTRRKVKARQFNNPKKREEIVFVPAHYTVRLSIAPAFKKELPKIEE